MRKRILTAMLILSLFSSMLVLPSGANQVEEAGYEIKLAQELGILSVDFSAHEELTRIQTVETVLNLKNIKTYSGSGKVRFHDLPLEDPSYEMIDTAVNVGIVMGDTGGTFRPKDKATDQEAMVMLLRGLGYEVLARSMGGTLSDYYSLANQYGLLKGVKITNQPLTALVLARMIRNTFDMGIVEQASFGNEEGEFLISKEKTALSYLKLAKGKGVVTENDISSIYYSNHSAAFSRVIINEKEYATGKTNARAYLGYQVEYYYQEEGDLSLSELKYLFPVGNITLSMELKKDLFSIKNGKLYYDNEGKEIALSVRNESCILLNGTAVEYDLSLFLTIGNTGRITFLNNQILGNFYSVVLIESYQNDVVKSVDQEKGHIYLANNQIENRPYIALPMETDAVIEIYMDGDKISLSDLEEGNVISYSVSKNYARINVSDRVVSGVIREMGSVEDGYLVVNDLQYVYTSDFRGEYNLIPGKLVRLYVNYLGQAVDTEFVVEKNYAFVLNAGKSNDYEAVGLVKLFTLKGEGETFELAKKATMNGESITTDELLLALNNEKDDLIVYQLDQNGKIKNVDFVRSSTGNIVEDQKHFVLSHVITTNNKGYHVLDGIGVFDTVLFNVPRGDKIEAEDCTVEINGFNSNVTYNNVKFYDVGYDGIAKAAFINEAAIGRFKTIPEKIYLVKSIVDAIDSEGESGKKIYFYDRGVEKDLFISSEAYDVAIAKIPYDIKDLKIGDIFTFDLDIKGKIKNYSVYYVDALHKNSPGEIYYGGGGITPKSLAVQIINGVLGYQDDRVLSVLMVRSDGSFTQYPFKASPKAVVMKVDRTRKVITKVSLDSIRETNFETNSFGSAMVVRGNRDVLDEVIIYE